MVDQATKDLLREIAGIPYVVNIQEDSGDSDILYVGRAEPGTATSAAAWQVLKIDGSTGKILKWAGGDSMFIHVYDNRESLSYS